MCKHTNHRTFVILPYHNLLNGRHTNCPHTQRDTNEKRGWRNNSGTYWEVRLHQMQAKTEMCETCWGTWGESGHLSFPLIRSHQFVSTGYGVLMLCRKSQWIIKLAVMRQLKTLVLLVFWGKWMLRVMTEPHTQAFSLIALLRYNLNILA